MKDLRYVLFMFLTKGGDYSEAFKTCLRKIRADGECIFTAWEDAIVHIGIRIKKRTGLTIRYQVGSNANVTASYNRAQERIQQHMTWFNNLDHFNELDDSVEYRELEQAQARKDLNLYMIPDLAEIVIGYL